MSLRIEYFRAGEKVMVTTCLKAGTAVKKEALEGLDRYNADMARIRDTDHGSKIIGVVMRDTGQTLL